MGVQMYELIPDYQTRDVNKILLAELLIRQEFSD
jgi:hypothetical protein